MKINEENICSQVTFEKIICGYVFKIVGGKNYYMKINLNGSLVGNCELGPVQFALDLLNGEIKSMSFDTKCLIFPKAEIFLFPKETND